MSEKSLVDIRLLNKEFTVLCEEEEKAALYSAASYLDKKMREMRNSSKAIGAERIAIITALNLAHELLSLRQQQAQVKTTAPQRTIENSSINQRLSQLDDMLKY